MVSDKQIQEIIDKIDMVEVVGEFVHLEKAGSNYKGLCPFHSEDTPSFIVSPEKKLASCFGQCNLKLGPIRFIEQIKHYKFMEAVEYLADKANVKIDISSQKGPDYSKLYKMMDSVHSYYTRNLFETESGKKALEYLNKRGLSNETIKEFGIGLASEERTVIYRLLSSLGYNTLDMVDSGLVKRDDAKSTYYDFFNKRIMFPVKDRYGHVVGFSGRLYNGETGTAKYLNSPETKIFEKRVCLYNLDQALDEITKKKRVFLCEGQMDVIAMHRGGFPEAVCSMGASFSVDQIKVLKEVTDKVVVCFDNDAAGIGASQKAIKEIKKAGMKVELIRWENAKDPDEFISKFGLEKFKDFVENNIISEFEYNFLTVTRGKDYSSVTVIEETKIELFNLIKQLNSNVTAEKYLIKFAEIAGVSSENLLADYNIFTKNKNYVNDVITTGTKAKGGSTNIADKTVTCEIRLMKYATLSKEWALQIEENVDLKCYSESHQSIITMLVYDFYEYYDEYDEDTFLGMLAQKNSNLFKVFTDDLIKLDEMIEIKFDDNDLKQCIAVVNEKGLDKRAEEINRLMKTATDSEKISYINELLSIRRMKEQKRDRS